MDDASAKPAGKVGDDVPRPLFAQIERELRARILDGTYSVHDQLPSEAALTRRFGVSRVTVRQALAELRKDGLIFRINGKGTFVSKPKTSFDLTRLRGFGEAMAGLGHETFSRVVEMAEVPADRTVSEQLAVDRGAPVTRIDRLRYLNREPVSLDVSFVHVRAGERLSRADLEREDLIQLLENHCGLTLNEARVNIESLLCDAGLAERLGIVESAAILRIERRVTGPCGRPLLYENLFYRGDAFRYSFAVTRPQGS